MDTCHKMSVAAEKMGYEMRVIGIPKTVDNDLPITDHCPGYASSAKYLAATVMETGIDLSSVSTKNKVCILEAMGRNAGWLTAAAALAKRTPDEAPHLIYLPEVPFDTEQFLKDVQAVYDRLGYCYVVASEGIVDKDGNYIAADGKVDAFGHAQLSGAGETLKNLVEERLGLKARCNTLGTAQRSAMHFASKTDAEESYATGKRAVELALSGKSGIMVTLDRQPGDEYVCTLGEAPLSEVANVEKKVPLEWITPEGNYVTDDFIKYCRPLIEGEVEVPMKNGLPDYVSIDKTLGRVQK
jgi:6-phosphofructokinase 1